MFISNKILFQMIASDKMLLAQFNFCLGIKKSHMLRISTVNKNWSFQTNRLNIMAQYLHLFINDCLFKTHIYQKMELKTID